MNSILAAEGRTLIAAGDPILVTGAGGFIGRRVVERLSEIGFRRIRCLVRPGGEHKISALRAVSPSAIEIVEGNLLSPADCLAAVSGAAVILHLAAARGEKSVPDAFLNSVVTTRNLLEAACAGGHLRRFVNVSSFTAYAGVRRSRMRPLEESDPVEDKPELRGDAYTYAKVKQEQIVAEYARTCGLPCVTVRPGYVYGPGNEPVPGRVGIGTFGIFLHLGGANTLPLTYVDNCADAVVLAGLTPGIDGQTFNIVDDDLPTSRAFLRLYKRNVRTFRSIYLPHAVSYALCALWEKYSRWSAGQLPPTFNSRMWHAYWGRTRYTNEKAKNRLGWRPAVSTAEGLRRYFDSARRKALHA
jgi:nucleoside-diphosphate-sugar epimerase